MKNCYIEKSVKISKSAKIYPFVTILGNSKIEDDCIIYPYTFINNSKIGKGTIVYSSQIINSDIGENVSVGPNAHLRMNTQICNNVRIGNYVEIKKSIIGQGSKIAHLTYVGDAQVGKNCNLGCGVVFCNYDGKLKHKTIVGDNVFIGSNVNLIAPINLGDNSFIAAGSTVTKNVEDDTFCIARTKQQNKPKRKE